MMTLRQTLLVGGLGVTALLGGGCEKENDFSYVKVSVKIADSASADFLRSIASCGVNVLDTSGEVLDFASISCPEGQVTNHQLGVVDWSTAESGTVRFAVTVKNRATCEIGKGTSGDITIVKNGTATGSVQVDPRTEPCPGAPVPVDGGTAADSGTDSR
jgi:hypothetical protein